MIRRSSLLFTFVLASTSGFGQSAAAPLTLPAGTPLSVQIDENLPMRVGTPIRAHLLYPVYDGATLAVPADTVVLGSITGLQADRSRRVHARLNADFTPFHTPIVHFVQLVLPDGSSLALPSDDAADGAPIFRIVAPPPPTGGFIHQQFDILMAAAKDRLHVITGPDKADRLKQLFYSQLPYHPQRVAKGTNWTVETTRPITLAKNQLPASPGIVPPAPVASDGPPTWMVQAYLNDALTSASTKVGQEIKATVAEPIYNADGTVAVPQGSVLLGAITKSKPARRLGRAGSLSFSFRQLVLPGQEAQSVQTTLKGTDASSAADLAMNSEGEVKPKPQDKIIIPALLILLASRPMDEGEHQFAKDGVSSNSLGTIGFIVGLAAQSPNIATGIGAYGAALSIYSRVLARGKEVTFHRDTRIVLQTTGRRSTAIKPDPSSERPR